VSAEVRLTQEEAGPLDFIIKVFSVHDLKPLKS